MVPQDYLDACDYPGVLNHAEVEASLRRYLDALGVKRKIQRIMPGWELSDLPDLERTVFEILKKLPARAALDARAAHDARDARAALAASAARDARDALDARDARAARAAQAARDALDALDARAALVARAAHDARDALDALDALDARAAHDARDALDALDARAAHGAGVVHDAHDARAALAAHDAHDARPIQRFAAWCIQAYWWYWGWDMSYLATYSIGARQLANDTVLRWANPIYDAFKAGCWLLYWTDNTLYWAAKPTVHFEETPGARRLHNSQSAALESDVENIYFWHGVMVPAFVVVKPEWITVKHIETEDNAEVRRVMIERYGQERYLKDSSAEEIHRDDFGILYRKAMANDEPLVMVKVVNSTPEMDGSFKDYFIRVDPNCRPMLDDNKFGDPQELTARNAVASTFGKKGEEYDPVFQT